MGKKALYCDVNIAFSTRALRRLCESEACAEEELGVKAARGLKQRLAELRAVTVVTELVAGRPHEIDRTPHASIGLDVGDGVHLIFGCNHSEVPTLKSGSVDWAKVSRIQIQELEVFDG